MPLILPGNVASATAGAYSIANSCRFNSTSSSVMSFTTGTPTSGTNWTVSLWIKRGLVTDAGQVLWGCHTDTSNRVNIKFDNGDIEVFESAGTLNLLTNAKYRDPGAWMNVVLATDTTQGTDTNRMKLYVNGTQVTSFSSTTYPAEDDVLEPAKASKVHRVGAKDDSYWDGYVAEVAFIDGQQLAATSFGQFNEDSPTIWEPKDISGLTFGNNGYWLDFEDSSALGNDVSGENNDFTPANLDATDSSTDTPTNNFCVMNPLDKYWGSWTLSNGNNTVSATNAAYVPIRATVGLTAGKWYWEVEFDAWSGTGQQALIGICATDRTGSASGNGLAEHAYDYAYLDYDGKIYGPSNANASYGDTYTTGDIIGVYLDLDNNKLYFGKNGTIQASGTGFSIVAAASTTLGCYFPAVSDWTSNGYATFKCNFGSGQFGDTALSSAVADANGFGQFEYDPSDGGGSSFDSAAKDFLAICSANLGSDGG